MGQDGRSATCSTLRSSGQVAWLIPAAPFLGIAGLWLTRRTTRTDSTRTAIIGVGGWLAVTMLVFSFAGGSSTRTTPSHFAPRLAQKSSGLGPSCCGNDARAYSPETVMAATVQSPRVAFVLLNRSNEFPAISAPLLAAGFIVALCDRHRPSFRHGWRGHCDRGGGRRTGGPTAYAQSKPRSSS